MKGKPKTLSKSRRIKLLTDMKITSKKAETLLVEEISEIITELSDYPSSIEENLALLRQGKNKTKYKKSLVEVISTDLTEVETRITSLIALSPDNKAIEIYQKKLDKWQTEFEELRSKQIKKPSMLSSIFSESEEEIENKRDLKKIKSIEFDDNDPNQIAKTLLKLVEEIDYYINEDEDEKVKKLISKFNSGIAILKTISADNKYMHLFDEKQLEWKAKQEHSNKEQTFVVIGCVIVLIIIICCL